MNPTFKDKVVLVTGASAGIGEATAILLAQLGAKLALVGRDAANLRAVAERCERENGLKPLEIVADLATDEGVEKTAKDTIQHFGRLDVLVNNAAVGARATIQTTDMATFDRVFTTNVRSVYNLTRLLVPELIKTKGNIVNVSSIAGTSAHIGSLPYGMTKAALDQFSKLTAVELAPLGVRVNTVSPGVTVSKFVQRLTGASDEAYQQWLEATTAGIPLRRACSSLDIAKAIVHLASDDNSACVTGALLTVDGALKYADPNFLTSQTDRVQ